MPFTRLSLPILALTVLCFSLPRSGTAATAAQFTSEQSPPFEAQALGYMPYRMYKAQGYDLAANSARNYPLIVWLHGLGERGTNNTSQMVHGVVEIANDTNQTYQPAFVIAPQTDTSSGGWSSETDAASVVSETRLLLIIKDLQSKYRIDPDRIYLVGLSYGGSGTWNLITHHPGLFAAAVPMSQPASGGNLELALLAHFPVWSFDGSNDTLTAGTINAVRNVGGRANYTVITGAAHNDATWVTAANDRDMYKWLMAQRRLTVPDTSSFPHLRISGPSSTRSFVTANANTPLSGIAALTTNTLSAFSSITWKNSAGGNGTAAGTTSWTAGPATLTGSSNLIQVIATATNNTGFTSAGTCTFNDSIMVNDATPPQLFLLNPTTGGSYISPTDSLRLRGYATDNFAVNRISWANDRGGYGVAGADFGNQVAGQVHWTIHEIPLKPGHNGITLVASDLAGNTATQTLRIFRSPARGGDFFRQTFDTSTNYADYVDTSFNPAPNSFYQATAADAAGSISIASGALQIQRTGSAGTTGLIRTYAMEGPPQASSPNVAVVTFDLNFPSGSPSHFGDFATIGFGYYLGSAAVTSLGGFSIRNADLLIRGNGTNAFRLKINGGTGDSAGFPSTGGAKKISWFINSSTSDQSYLAPDGTTQTLAANLSDIWVNTTKALAAQPKLSTYLSRNLRHFEVHSTTALAFTLQFDNFAISDFKTGSAYGLWLENQFTQTELPDPSICGVAADIDSDGLSTLEEYAFGGDPQIPSASSAPQGGISADHLQTTFARVAPTDVTYLVQASDTLNPEGWTTIATLAAGSTSWTGVATVTETGSGATRSVTVTDPETLTDNPSRFLRVVVQASTL